MLDRLRRGNATERRGSPDVRRWICGQPGTRQAAVVSGGRPATVFLATGFLNSTEPFWWDELAALILSGESQSSLGQSVRAAIPEIIVDGDLPEEKSETTEKRRAVLYRVCEALRRLNDQQRRSAMIGLESQLAPHGRPRQSIANRAMTSSEVRALIADGRIAIGAHTVSHPVLVGLDAAACYREVAESKTACEALIGAPVITFAYPYGAFDTDAREAVRSAGLTVACSMRPGPAVSEF